MFGVAADFRSTHGEAAFRLLASTAFGEACHLSLLALFSLCLSFRLMPRLSAASFAAAWY